MLTKFSVLRRRADLTPDQFSRHWRTIHVHVLVTQAGHKTYNRRYVQNHFLAGPDLPGLSTEFDGAAQMLPPGDGVVTRGFQEDPLYARFVRPDEQLFLDVPACRVVYCDSQVRLADPQAGGVKLLEFTRRAPGQTHAQFMQAWAGPQADALRTLPGLRGLVLHEVRQEGLRGMGAGEPVDPRTAWDGVLELRFAALDALRAALAAHPRPEDPLVMSFVAREDLIYDDTAIR